MAKRIIISDPQWKYYRVKLTQTIGTGAAAVIIEGWIRHIWAHDRNEAAIKAILFHLKRNPGTEPHLETIELEPYSRSIQI